ncbi:hypothetical protein [Adlercreutzia sp. ZJ473]|uniref:hypothetical protein n=1 Tax=Adlercreutzia sp. ZJ473 TaxID=2722822 RepID=UPI00155665FE|nr:hypothetical protein [Adlercreutzia sp. ZJ473]
MDSSTCWRESRQGGSEDFPEDRDLVLRIKIHWSLTLGLVLFNVAFAWLAARAAWRVAELGAEGERVLSAVFPLLMLAVVDGLAVPVCRKHRVTFKSGALAMELGTLSDSLRYSDIQSVSEKGVWLAAYQWRPTAPGAVRIRTRAFDGAVALEDKELFYEELLRRNPDIDIIRAS